MSEDLDRLIGQRLREARERRKMSQTALGAFLGVSFQQVQKYERGVNRISCSTLLDAAKALKLPVAYFFEGLDPLASAEQPTLARELAMDHGGRYLAEAYLRLPHERRGLAVELVRTVGRDA